MNSNLLSISEVAKQLGVHPDTVRRAIRKGALKAHRVETLIRIQPEALQEYLQRGTVKSGVVNKLNQKK